MRFLPLLSFLLAAVPFANAGELVCTDPKGLEIRGNLSGASGSALFGDLTIHPGKGASPVIATIARKDLVGYWNHRGALLMMALDPLTQQTAFELNARCPKLTGAKDCAEKTGTFVLNLQDTSGKRLTRKAGTPVRCVHTR